MFIEIAKVVGNHAKRQISTRVHELAIRQLVTTSRPSGQQLKPYKVEHDTNNPTMTFEDWMTP